MKVIDLLNKIANGEEVPKKIRFDYNEYEYDEKAKTYYCGMDTLTSKYKYVILNEEVEIIEEKKKVPEPIKTKIGYGGLTYLEDENFSDGSNGFNHREDVIVNKITEIIDYLKSKGE